MGYLQHSISGFSWQTLLKLLTLGIVMVKVMFLARILSPNDFGLFALITIALGVAEATTETGVNMTIIQAKQSIEYFIDTAWVIAIIRGFIIGSLLVFLGMFMSWFYAESSLTILVALAGLIPVIKGFINPSIILFQKNLEFFKDSAFRFAVITIETIASILGAFFLESVAGLILGLIVGGLFEVFLSFLVFSHKPRFQYISSRAKIIFSNAKGLSISAVLSYLNQNIDDFLLGKILGTHSLGLYHNAYSLGHKTNFDFAKSAHHSILPIFTKISHDTNRIKKAFLKSVGVTLVLISVLSLPLLIAPEFMVSFLLGASWMSIAPSLHLFVYAGIVQSISLLFYSLFFAQKQYSVVNYHLLLTVCVLVVLLLILPQRAGLQGAGMAILVSRVVSLPILFYAAHQSFSAKEVKERV